MPIIAENNSSPHVPIPAGTHVARCVEMIHIGTIQESEGIYAGKDVNKVRITWETPDEQHDFGNGPQPFLVSKDFTLSMNESATLRKMLEGWRGKAFSEEEAKRFDVSRLVGVPCMLSVIHKTSRKGNTYAEINGITALPKGFECQPQINPSRVLSFDSWDEALFNSLPDFLKNKIKTSRQYAAMMNPERTEATVPAAVSDEGLPF